MMNTIILVDALQKLMRMNLYLWTFKSAHKLAVFMCVYLIILPGEAN